jgi:LCP family protein required for cell wall assembly
MLTTRLVLALVVVSGTSAFGIGGGYWLIGHKLGGATTLHLNIPPGPPRNFLIIGSDSRAFVEDQAEAGHFGSSKLVGGQRADVIIIARVDPKTKHGLLVSIPRDTEVRYKGRLAKINSTFEGGPDGVIAALDQNFHIQINRYVQVDFKAFRQLVDAISGVRMYIPYPERDKKTGLSIKTPGCITLNGEQALAYVRSRYFEYFETGRWHSDPTADIGRINRQQDFIRRVMQQAIRSGARNPVRANHLANVALDNLKIDEQLAHNKSEVFSLVRTFRSFNPASVEMVTVPTESAPFNASIGSALKVKLPDANLVFAKLRGLNPSTSSVLPGSVQVRVLNGTGVSGQAGDTLSRLQQVGFIPAGSGDAPNYRFGTTKIRYAPAAVDKARLLARYLNGVGQLVEDVTVRNVDVVLVTGPDFRGVSDKPGIAPPVTTTTALASTPQTTARASGAAPQQNC